MTNVAFVKTGKCNVAREVGNNYVVMLYRFFGIDCTLSLGILFVFLRVYIFYFFFKVCWDCLFERCFFLHTEKHTYMCINKQTLKLIWANAQV